MRIGFSIALCGALASACVIDTVPLPDGTGCEPGEVCLQAGEPAPFGINESGLYYADNGGTTVLLLGVAGTVLPNSRVVVVNSDRNSQEEIDATADGSFVRPGVVAALGDLIEISMERDGIVHDTVTLRLLPGSTDAYAGNARLDASFDEDAPPPVAGGSPPADPTVFVTTGTALVSVTGTAGTSAAGLTVVIANLDSGEVVTTFTDFDGSFTATIGAVSGDTLSIFTVEQAVNNASGAPLLWTVP